MSCLITAAWDQGCRHAQCLRHAQALSFLTAAIDLMDLCDDFKDTKEVQKLPCFRMLPCDHSVGMAVLLH